MKDIKEVWSDRKRTFLGLPISFTKYFLTEDKIITRTGFLNLAEDELDIYRVTDKKLLLPLSQRIFGCGTIILYVKDVDTPQKEIKCIKNPRAVLKLIDKNLNTQRDKYNIRGREMIGQDQFYNDDDLND